MKHFSTLTAACLLSALWLMPARLSAQVSASVTSGCAPLNVSFSTPATGGPWQWSFSNGATSAAAAPSVCFTTPGSYSVTLTVGTGSSATTYIAGDLVNVYANPVPVITLDTNAACAGTMLAFSAAGASGSSFTWDFGDGNIVAGALVQHAYNTSGVYNILLQETSQYGCSGIQSLSNAVTVMALPETGFEMNPGLLCDLGDTVWLEAADTTLAAYNWRIDGVTVGTAQNHAAVFTAPGNYVIELSSTSASGCFAQSSDTLHAFNAILPLWQNIDTAGCVPHTFNASVAGQSYTAVQWESTLGMASGPSLSTQFVNPGTYQVYFTATDPNGCEVRDTIYNIAVLPSANALFTTSDSVLCDSGQVVLTAVDTLAVFHSWMVGNITLAGNPLVVDLNAIGDYEVTHVAGMVNGCNDTAIVPELIHVESASPQVGLAPATVCRPHLLEVEHENSVLTSALWISDLGDTIANTGGAFLFDTLGSFGVTFIGQSISGCVDTVHYPAVRTVIETDINFNGPSVIDLCADDTLQFDGTILSPGNHHWYFGDGAESTDSISFHTYSEPGTYHVSFTSQDYNGCVFDIDTHTIVRVSSLDVDFYTEIVDCDSGGVLFTAQSSQAVSWQWSLGGAQASGETVTHMFPANQPVQATLVVTDSLGCERSKTKLDWYALQNCNNMSGAGQTETEFPVTSIVIGSEHVNSACAPASFDFNSPFDSTYTTLWYFGDGASAQGALVTHVYDSAATFDLQVAAIDTAGDTFAVTLPAFVRIGKPTADFSLDIAATCQGTNIEINNLSEDSDHWTTVFGDGQSSTEFEPQHTYDAAGYFTLQLTAYDSLGCTATASRLVMANNPNQAMTLPARFCLGDTASITHNVKDFAQYLWHLGAQTVTGQFPQVALTSAGTHALWLEAIDMNGCSTPFFEGSEVQVLQPAAAYTLPADPAACGSFAGTLTNISTGAKSYRWYINDSLFSISRNVHVLFDDTGSYAIRLQAKNGVCYHDSPVDTVWVREAVADFTYQASSMCLPASVTFSGQGVNAAQWVWEPGDGNTYTAATPVVTFNEIPQAGMVLNFTDIYGCTATVTKPAVDFLAVAVVPDITSGCAPLNVVLTDTVGSAVSWSWNTGSGTTLTGNPVSATVGEGYPSVQVTATHTSGCSTVFVFDSLVHAADPQAAFLLDSNTQGFCAPLLASFLDESEGATAWHWDFGDGTSSQNPSPKHFYQLPGHYAVTLIVEGQYGCADTLALTGAVDVLGPVAGFGLADNTLCMFDSITPFSTSQNAVEYLWMFGDGFSSNEQAPAHAYSLPGPMAISLTVTDSLGCTDGYTNNLTVHKTPVPALAVNTEGNCLPVTVELDEQSLYLDNPTFTWQLDSQTVVSGSDTLMTVRHEGIHSLKLHIVNANGCQADTVMEQAVLAYDTVDNTPVRLEQLSVQQGGAEVAYHLQPAFNFEGYTLYAPRENNTWKAVHSGSGDIVSLLDSTQAGRDTPACFRLQESHHCVKTVPVSQLPLHCSVHTSVNKANAAHRVEWTPLTNAHISGYAVYSSARHTNGFSLLGTVSATQNHFTDTTQYCPDSILYYVEAIDINHTANNGRSNTHAIVADTPDVFREPLHVDRVTVLEDEVVLVEWQKLRIAPYLLGSAFLVRTDSNDMAELIAIHPEQTEYIDREVGVQNEWFTYQVAAQNVCNVPVPIGQKGNSILLRLSQDGQEVDLQWNEYEAWEGEVKHYEVQVKNASGEWETLQTVDEGENRVRLNLLEIEP